MTILIPILIAIFLAINMGGSGTSPSFSAAYGANIIKKSYIPILFGTFVLLGALIAGEKVITTIGGSVLPADVMSSTVVSIVLLSSALSIFFANLLRVPQSTSQSTVFSLVGCAVPLGVLESSKLFYEILPTWLIMPLISFLVTYGLGYSLIKVRKSINNINFDNISNYKLWKYITIACSCYVAFSIGSNNVANSVGPIVSLAFNEFGSSGNNSFVLLFSIILIAPFFGIGSAFFGKNVTATVGREITQIGVTEATIISLITATLLLIASTTRGIPTSLVQMNTFAVIAVGMLKDGPRSIISKLSVAKLFSVWIIAPIIAMAISYLLTHLSLYLLLLP
ncbi:MAG: anion permease [Bacillota bacterium]|nr:inorganic phosphate transporter family protein [Bacillota bacterium]MDW7728878.1 anion permease [Bacillota bacterium]